MPAFKRDDASRLRDAERCMKAGKPLTVREASFTSLLMVICSSLRITIEFSVTKIKTCNWG